jgi:agmatinase
MNHIVGMTQMGIRNVSSSNRDDYEAAHEAGSKILSVRDVRRLGVDGVLALIPQNINYYITIDIDGFDPSIAPGTGTPSHGGFLYYEVLEIIQALAKRSKGNIVGMDLVEVAPVYDPTGMTSILAAQLLLNSIGFIFHERGKVRAAAESETTPAHEQA